MSKRTRREFQEHLVGWVLRDIRGFFEDESFVPGPEVPNASGERRGLVASYYTEIDWRNPSQVRRFLNVMQTVMMDTSPEYREKLKSCLRIDGYTVDDDCRIHGGPVGHAPELPVGALTDPSAIWEHMERITDTQNRDPAAAISGAKALIESTAKLVLDELHQEYDSKADIAELVKLAQKALRLHPSQIAPTAKGAETTKRILSNLSQLAVGVADLRNEYGADHGRSSPHCGSPEARSRIGVEIQMRRLHRIVGSRLALLECPA